MRRRYARRAIILVLVVCTLPAAAQSTSDAQDTIVADAEPYGPGEFPGWARDLRRAEIVALGSLPISLLASRLLYGIGRFTVKSIQAGAFDPAYLPPGIAPPGAVPLSRTENAWIVVGAASISAIVAVIDYALGRDHGPDG